MKKTTWRMVLCAVFAALTCALAPLSLPLPFSPVPITLATLASMFSGAVLKAKTGALSQIVYVLLGCVGLPVFAGFSSGFGALAGYSGGFLIGYICMAWTVGIVYGHVGSMQKKPLRKSLILAGACVAGTAMCYAIGTIWFLVVMKTSLSAALLACVVPFLGGDVLKIALVSLVTPQLERAMARTTLGVQML